jgi:sec-independent protein translocase protein TatA
MNSTLLIFNLGGPEIILIVLVVLLLFGGRKIPELMKGLGKGIKEFNNAKANIESEIKDNIREIEEPKKEAILEKKSANE